jgi:hypothetical protein
MDTLWVGKSLKSGGFVVYDPELQREHLPNLVYLFNVDRQQVLYYDRTRVPELFVKTQSVKATQTIIEVYHKWLERMERRNIQIKPLKIPRRAHCWNCGENLSTRLDYVCDKCGWILCKCGACGCNYPGWD